MSVELRLTAQYSVHGRRDHVQSERRIMQSRNVLFTEEIKRDVKWT